MSNPLTDSELEELEKIIEESEELSIRGIVKDFLKKNGKWSTVYKKDRRPLIGQIQNQLRENDLLGYEVNQFKTSMNVSIRRIFKASVDAETCDRVIDILQNAIVMVNVRKEEVSGE